MSSAFEILFDGEFFLGPEHVEWRNSLTRPPAMQTEIQAFWQSFAQPHHFNGRIARLDSWAHIRGELFLTLSPSDYQTLIYSNQFVESICQRWGEAYLSKALGISCVLVSADHRVPLMVRSAAVGEYPGATDVFGGHIDLAPDPHETDICTCMAAEIRQELNVDLACADLIGIGLISTVETRKPELIFTARTHLQQSEIAQHAKEACDRDEYSRLFFLAGEEVDPYIMENQGRLTPSALGALTLFGRWQQKSFLRKQ